MTVVLMGDSHLARVRRDLSLFGPGAGNVAEGGSTVLELADQLDGVEAHGAQVVVLSVGTNDAALHRAVSLNAFRDALERAVDRLQGREVIYLAPPGVVETRLAGQSWSNARIDDYRFAAVEVCDQRGLFVVRADCLLSAVGPRAFAADGLHLNAQGYRAVLPVLAEQCRRG